MLQGEYSAILLTCIKQSVLKNNYGLLFEWPLKTGVTVHTETNVPVHVSVCPEYMMQPL